MQKPFHDKLGFCLDTDFAVPRKKSASFENTQ